MTLVVLVTVCLTACGNGWDRAQSTSADIEELQREKLSLEIEQLRQEQRFFVLNRWIGTVGGLLGSVAVLWTIARGYRTLRHQVETQRADRIAELLTSLSDERTEVRVGAARGLSRYADAVLAELLSALKLEASPQASGTIVETLTHIGDRQFSRVTGANANTLSMRAYYLGRLREAGATSDYTEALLQLSSSSCDLVRREYRAQYDYGRRLQKQRVQRAKNLHESEADENLAVVTLAAQEARLALGTARVIAQLLREGRRPAELAGALDFSSTNLYRARLSRLDLCHSLLGDCLMRHVHLASSKMIGCDVSHSDLFGASLGKVDLSEAMAVGAHLRSSKGRDVQLRRANLEDAILSESDLPDADFREARARRAQFRGAKLRRAVFDSCDLIQAEFQQAELQQASFRRAKCYRVEFIEADLTGACLVDAQLGGADLRGADLRNANLRNADLSGANIGQADFRGADLTGVTLRKTRNVDRAVFDADVELVTEQGETETA
jgi:uncharacterized protein YjbI with pentapeptide repeats